MKFKIGRSVQDRLSFRRAIGISRSEGEADGKGGELSTREGLAGIDSEVGTFIR